MSKADAYDGLSNLAHAIRRSTAVYVAMQVTPPESEIEDMLVNADRIAAWIGGHAEEQEAEQQREAKQPLGEPWPPVD